MNAVAARFFHTPTPTRPRFAGAGVFNCQQPLSNPALAADIQRNAAALAPSLADPVLLQGSAVSQITAQAAKEAAIVAYSDLFALLTAMASVATLTAFALWAYRRYHRIDILAKEKAVVFAMLGK